MSLNRFWRPDIWRTGNSEYENGADEIIQAVLDLMADFERDGHHSLLFSYGGPEMCEYGCFAGLRDLLSKEVTMEAVIVWDNRDAFSPNEKEP